MWHYTSFVILTKLKFCQSRSLQKSIPISNFRWFINCRTLSPPWRGAGWCPRAAATRWRRWRRGSSAWGAPGRAPVATPPPRPQPGTAAWSPRSGPCSPSCWGEKQVDIIIRASNEPLQRFHNHGEGYFTWGRWADLRMLTYANQCYTRPLLSLRWHPNFMWVKACLP